MSLGEGMIALDHLQAMDLLEGTLPAGQRGARLTRRRFLRKAGVAGAVTLPVIRLGVGAGHSRADQLDEPVGFWCGLFFGITLLLHP